MAVAEIGDLEHALDLALKVDLAAADPVDRRAAVAALGRLESKFTALQAEIVGEYDAKKDWVRAGHRSPAVGVRETAKVPAPSAHRAVAVARSLREMPLTADALRHGSLSTAHAMRLRKTATRPAFAGDGERLLVAKAATLTWSEWLKTVAYWEQLADDETSDPADPDPRDTRAEFHAHRTLDGRGDLIGTLGPVGFEAFEEALHRIERELFQADWRDAVEQHGKDATSADMRPPAQRRAAALVEMAHRAMSAPKDGKRPLPLVVIHTDPDTLNAELARVLDIEPPELLGTPRMCETDAGTVIGPSAMMREALAGTIRRLVHTSRSHVLDYGREVRLFTGPLRQAIIHAARTCTEPGCDTRASRCEIDHRQDWNTGGHTRADNAQPLCRGDHRHKPRTDPG